VKVLITGGAGFIGSRLAGRLLDRGDTVFVVDDLSLGTRENVAPYASNPRFALRVMDVCAGDFPAVVREAAPERVYHLAANSDIPAGLARTRTDLDKTFLTTFAVLDAMKLQGCRELVFASTSAIYGEADGDLREDHGPLKPISLYGAAKLASEGYVSAYCALFGIRAWVYRFPNVIGPNLTHGVIYDFVRRMAKDPGKLEVLGNGSQTKPYLHVDDLLDAILLGAQHPAQPVATYNVAGEGLTSVREIAETVREEMGLADAKLVYGTSDRGWPGDVPRFAYDTARIRALGWKPTLSSTEAVRAAVRAEVARCRRSS
jgi:UDP-glucose 4-epimerase